MHLGKQFPRAINIDWGLRMVSPHTSPPRRVGFRCSDAELIGDLALAWANIDVKGSICERLDDGRLYWFIDHPTLYGYQIKVYWRYETTGSPPTRMNLIKRYEYWAEDTMMGDQEFPVSLETTGGWTQGFQSGRWMMQANQSAWLNRPFPLRLVTMAFWGVYVLAWGDDPDYQPYRTRP